MYIKYKDFRINLDQIAAYRPIDDRSKPLILFVTTSTRLKELKLPLVTWTFDTEDQRDAMLEKLDEIAGSEEIKLSDNGDGSVEATVF